VQPKTYTVGGNCSGWFRRTSRLSSQVLCSKETQQGIATDAKGKFSIHLPQGNDTLRWQLCRIYDGRNSHCTVRKKTCQLSINLLPVDVLLQDVTIYAYQGGDRELTNASVLSLQSEKIKTSTSIFPDVLRSEQILPGVSTNNEINAICLILCRGTEIRMRILWLVEWHASVRPLITCKEHRIQYVVFSIQTFD